jgi:hypothetical protein
MLVVQAQLEDGNNTLPQHWGGVLHGFVERAIMQHTPHLLPLLRPAGKDDYACMAITPPSYGMELDGTLRFGVILFRDATQSWNQIARAILQQAESKILNRTVQIEMAWMCQPGREMQPAILHDRMVDPPPWPESPAAWLRNFELHHAEAHEETALHQLDFSSPLLVGSRNSIRRDNTMPWPSIKTLLDSIAKRMLVLEPELAQHVGLYPEWVANEAYASVAPLTKPENPAKHIHWQYSHSRSILKPGIVGPLLYCCPLGALEIALLEWGQWLGVGQQTTMGCGRYTYSIF